MLGNDEAVAWMGNRNKYMERQKKDDNEERARAEGEDSLPDKGLQMARPEGHPASNRVALITMRLIDVHPSATVPTEVDPRNDDEKSDS